MQTQASFLELQKLHPELGSNQFPNLVELLWLEFLSFNLLTPPTISFFFPVSKHLLTLSLVESAKGLHSNMSRVGGYLLMVLELHLLPSALSPLHIDTLCASDADV